MFFSLTNSPATFQTMMNEILKEEITTKKVLVYLDDILIFAKDCAEHRKQVQWVLDILHQYGLCLKLEKCEFKSTETEYLGMIISEGNIHMDPVKMQCVADWPTPHSKGDVQSFLGFCNFYWHFVKDYAGVARPLNQLTGNTPFTWRAEQEEAFQKL